MRLNMYRYKDVQGIYMYTKSGLYTTGTCYSEDYITNTKRRHACICVWDLGFGDYRSIRGAVKTWLMVEGSGYGALGHKYLWGFGSQILWGLESQTPWGMGF